jgi:hypothetical protein
VLPFPSLVAPLPRSLLALRARHRHRLLPFLRLQRQQTAVHKVELVLAERLVDVPQLVGVDVHVVVGDEARDKLAVEKVVSGVRRAQAPVGVGVAVGAAAERAR